ncbi:hypothetical protein [Gordonia sp. NPDC003376]
MTTNPRPPDSFDLYRDGTWGRPFRITQRSTGQTVEYGANTVWQEDQDGTLHVYGSVDQDEYVPEDEGERGRFTVFHFDPFIDYAPGDWDREFVVPE